MVQLDPGWISVNRFVSAVTCASGPPPELNRNRLPSCCPFTPVPGVAALPHADATIAAARTRRNSRRRRGRAGMEINISSILAGRAGCPIPR